MANEPTNKVSVTDVDMPFFSMVRFMVKWAIAAIPALFILMILGAIFWGLLLGFFIGIGSDLFHRGSEKTSTVPYSSSSTSTPATSSSKSSSVDAAVTAYLPNVIVKNIEVVKSYLNEMGVYGEVKNNGTRTLKEVEITIYCLGPDGKPIFEKQYHPVLVSEFAFGHSNQPLKPGYSRQFGVKMDDAPSEWIKKVDVKVTSVAFQ